MRNAVVFICYNTTEAQLDLAKQAYAGILAQDIGPLEIHVIDNGSTAPTQAWTESLEYGDAHEVLVTHYAENTSPVQVTNTAFAAIFARGYEQVLGVSSDVILPPNLYRKLAKRPEQVVTPGMHGTNPPAIMEEVKRIHGDVHTAVCLTRKSAYDALMAKYGYFLDPGFFMYANDCDMKMRMVECGISTAQTDILCWHYGGASHRLRIGAEEVYRQADKDREYFAKKWGFPVGDPQYNAKIALLL